ncbi:type VI secretion system baseplate subunit TssK [Sphingomonas jatrophae]|uniref:Type VI secretion system protein ImpJ n=1 Tax=Sphingomonas jatrophae TaxID=1166337 RepID=A0A1I6LKQ6_9SPHN|nr:type VI secretion system baseplate subunit TssK [Sphingomonas jatrophae]SFS03882.1 type VI secretion system protein ImpJ [Sphingomonas jatrophae]
MAGKSRVAWREGLFLRPQHFQQQDRFFSGELTARIDGVRPYPWGLTEIVVDEDLATLGKFGVKRAVGVMPDGTPFAIPDDFPPPEPLDMPGDVRDGLVSLTLPAAQAGAIEFRESDQAGHDARFLVDESEVSDAFSDERAHEPIEVGRPNLRFGVTREQTYGRVTLGLVRVREVANKRLMFDDRYIPPALDIVASRRLKGGLADILGRAEQRADELALRAVEATDGGAETFASFLLLQALNRWVPMMRHMDSLPRIHPERLFETLVGLAGELATLTKPERKPPAFPRYDHENLQLTFEPVFDLLQSMLSAVFDRSAIQMPLDAAGPGAYVSTIVDHNLYQHGYFYLAVNAAAPLDEIRGRFPAVAKIGAVTKMRQIVESALPGVPLRHTPTPPPQLRVLPGYVYFELDRGAPDWRDFASAPALGLHVAGDWPQLKLELWCVKRAGR